MVTKKAASKKTTIKKAAPKKSLGVKKIKIVGAKIKAVDKQVKFYRLVVDADRTKIIDNISEMLQHAVDLPDSDDLEMPREVGNSEASVLLKVHSAEKQEFSLGAIRADDFPGTVKGRQIASLDVDSDTNLIEMTHIKIFEKNIVGVVYNHHGARISQLYPYLKHISAPISDTFHVEALLKRNSAGKLDDIPIITSGEISMHVPYVAQRDPGVRSTTESLQDLAASLNNSQFVIKLVRVKNQADQKRFWELVKTLVSTEDFREGLKVFKVKGKNVKTERTETIDFLKDQITQLRKIAKRDPKSRELNPQSAFDAIQLAYNDLKAELVAAISVDFHQ